MAEAVIEVSASVQPHAHSNHKTKVYSGHSLDEKVLDLDKLDPDFAATARSTSTSSSSRARPT